MLPAIHSHETHQPHHVQREEQGLRTKRDQEILGLGQIPKMVNGDHLYRLQPPSGAMVHIISEPLRTFLGAVPPTPPLRWTTSMHVPIGSTLGQGWAPPRSRRGNDGQKAFYINDPDLGNRIEPVHEVRLWRAGVVLLQASILRHGLPKGPGSATPGPLVQSCLRIQRSPLCIENI